MPGEDPVAHAQVFVLLRLVEQRAAAVAQSDSSRTLDAQRRIDEVVAHSPDGALGDPVRCSLDGEVFPCATVRKHAAPFRSRDDFPAALAEPL